MKEAGRKREERKTKTREKRVAIRRLWEEKKAAAVTSGAPMPSRTAVAREAVSAMSSAAFAQQTSPSDPRNSKRMAVSRPDYESIVQPLCQLAIHTAPEGHGHDKANEVLEPVCEIPVTPICAEEPLQMETIMSTASDEIPPPKATTSSETLASVRPDPGQHAQLLQHKRQWREEEREMDTRPDSASHAACDLLGVQEEEGQFRQRFACGGDAELLPDAPVSQVGAADVAPHAQEELQPRQEMSPATLRREATSDMQVQMDVDMEMREPTRETPLTAVMRHWGGLWRQRG